MKHRSLNCPVLFPEKQKAKETIQRQRKIKAEERAKQKEEKITLADELHRPARRYFPTRRYIVDKINDTWTADLMSMPKNLKAQETLGDEKIKQEEEERDRDKTASEKQTGDTKNDFLVVLDIFSRYAWVRHILKTDSATVGRAFKEIFKTSKSKPLKIVTDQGREFSGLIDKSKDQKEKDKTPFQCEHCGQYLKRAQDLKTHKNKHCPVLHTEKNKGEKTTLGDIELYFAYGRHKAAIAERFIRTLKDKIGRWMTNNNNTDYLPHIEEMVEEYNNTPHSNFKRNYTPAEARDPKNENKIYKLYYENPRPLKLKDHMTQKTDLKIDDLVRIQRLKPENVKEKHYIPLWSREIFIIDEIKNTQPKTYYLKDANNHKIKGPFYREELQKTKFKITDEMGDNKPRSKNNAMLGKEAVAKEAARQKKKKGKQTERKKQAKNEPQPSTSQEEPQPSTSTSGYGLNISETLENIPIKSLTNHELGAICRNFKGFKGVFSRDNLPDKIKNYECGIVNLDDHEGPGTHWVAYHRNKKLKFYFDSYGLPPPLEIKEYLKSPVLYSSDQIQDPNSVICGHLCIFVLEKLSNGWHLQPVINHLLDLKEQNII